MPSMILRNNRVLLHLSHQRGRKYQGAVLTITLIAWFRFKPHHADVIASLNKTCYAKLALLL